MLIGFAWLSLLSYKLLTGSLDPVSIAKDVIIFKFLLPGVLAGIIMIVIFKYLDFMWEVKKCEEE